MIGRYLSADERRNSKLGLMVGMPTMPFLALALSRHNGMMTGVGFAVVMILLWVAVGLQVRGSRLHDEKMNG